MKMAGVPVDDPAMVAARARIHAMGGPAEANVFTKILLALFGEYDWYGVPGDAGRDHAAAPLVVLQPATRSRTGRARSSCRC